MANKGQKCTPVDTPHAREAFLDALIETGSIFPAAQQVGISRETIYRWINKDEEFALQVKVAIDAACDVVVNNMKVCGSQGFDIDSKGGGSVVNAAKLFLSIHGKITDSSKSQVEHSGNVGIGGLAELAKALAKKRGNDDET